MDYLKAIMVAGCVMIVSPAVTLADDLNDAESGLVPIQFDKQLNPTYDRKFARQIERDGAPETVPLSRFNNVFQDYLDSTPPSSRSKSHRSGSGSSFTADGNQFSAQRSYLSTGNRQIASRLDARGRGGRGKAARRAKMKAKFDTNGDGVLDQTERAQMKEWRQQRKGNRQNGGGMRRKGQRGRNQQGGGQGGAGAGFSGFSDRGPAAGFTGFSDSGPGAIGAGASPDWQAPGEHQI